VDGPIKEMYRYQWGVYWVSSNKRQWEMEFDSADIEMLMSEWNTLYISCWSSSHPRLMWLQYTTSCFSANAIVPPWCLSVCSRRLSHLGQQLRRRWQLLRRSPRAVRIQGGMLDTILSTKLCFYRIRRSPIYIGAQEVQSCASDWEVVPGVSRCSWFQKVVKIYWNSGRHGFALPRGLLVINT
jgi:hypothetical protein